MDGEIVGVQRKRASLGIVLRLADGALRIWLLLETWRERTRQRRALLALDAHLLKDIGLSQADALREGSKPFWKD